MRKRIIRRVLFGTTFVIVVVILLIANDIRTNLGPSPECASERDAAVEPGKTSARSVQSGGHARCYLLHVPAGYHSENPIPVVITLHGFAANGSQIRRISQWDKLADRENFITIYPDGSYIPLRWNSDVTANASNFDDVQLIRDILAQAAKLMSVDRNHIYINGFSNGGGMSMIIACQAADIIAAIGLVEPGGFSKETVDSCSPSRPVAVIEFMGTGDRGPLIGDRSQDYLPHSQTSPLIGSLMNISSAEITEASPEYRTAQWAKLNHCALTPETIPATGKVPGMHYAGCQSNADVILYTVDGMGHQWPGGELQDLLGNNSADIDATVTMWQFFKMHQLNLE
jgi:polyhydroxybutyrate depolymerase